MNSSFRFGKENNGRRKDNQQLYSRYNDENIRPERFSLSPQQNKENNGNRNWYNRKNKMFEPILFEHYDKPSAELHKVLTSYQAYDTKDGMHLRHQILSKLNFLFRNWIKKVAYGQYMKSEMVEKLGGQIRTFGSYRLRVHNQDSDIDALCIAPRNIQRAHFFNQFLAVLKRQPEISECRAIKDAYVPVVKMKSDGIEVDLIFARLAMESIPNDLNLWDNNLLRDIDPLCVRGLNGVRVTEDIMSAVPNAKNFQLSLRAIKFWARTRGIYSNSMGYFGGVTWAILVAKICKSNPFATPAELVSKFMLVYSQWNWPKPVLLKKPTVEKFGMIVWDPSTYISDRYHLMPIITPSYPQQNSTFNVTKSAKKLIQSELERGVDITNSKNINWTALFANSSFFFDYHNFVIIVVNSNPGPEHTDWCGYVESKIRFLINNLEKHPKVLTANVHPERYPLAKEEALVFISNIACSNSLNVEFPKVHQYSSSFFVGLEIDSTERIDLIWHISDFNTKLISRALNQGFIKDGMNISLFLRGRLVNEY